MAVSKTRKAEILENLKESLQNAKSVSFTTNSWLTVQEISDLRKNLREVNSTFTLVKKTLLKIAFKEVYWVELEDSMLEWQIAVVCSNDDAVAWMWKVNEFIKSFKKDPKVNWAWAYFEWELKDAEATKVIASIPSRDVLLGRLVGSMLSPISALARFFNAASEKLSSEWLETLASVPAPKKEEPKVEEVKEEAKTEEIKVEEKVETPAEEPKSEEVAEKVEEKPAEEAKEEVKEEAKAEEKVEETVEEKKEEVAETPAETPEEPKEEEKKEEKAE